MAAILWSDVETLSASLAAVDEALQTDILNHVNTTLVVSRFKGGEDSAKLRLARMYLAAHHGEMVLRAKAGNSGGGAVVSKTISDRSLTVQYANGTNAGEREWLSQTGWGSEFMEIMGSVPSGRGPMLT